LADNTNMSDNSSGDILGQLSTSLNKISESHIFSDEFKSFSEKVGRQLENIEKNTLKMSQSAASDRIYGREKGKEFRGRQKDREENTRFSMGRRSMFRGGGVKLSEGFFDNVEDELLKGFLGSDFRNDFAKMFTDVEKQIGVSMKDIPGVIGRNMSASFMQGFKSTAGGQRMLSSIQDLKSKATEGMSSFLGKLVDPKNYGLNPGDIQGPGVNPAVNPANMSQSAGQAAEEEKYTREQFLSSMSSLNEQVRQSGDLFKLKVGEESGDEFSQIAKESLGEAGSSLLDKVGLGGGEGQGGGLGDMLGNMLGGKGGGLGGMLGGGGAGAEGAAAAGGGQGIGGLLNGLTGKMGGMFSKLSNGLGGMMSKLPNMFGKFMGAMGPWGIAIAAGAKLIINKALNAIAPAIEGFKKLAEGMKKAANREQASRKAAVEAENKRIRADVEEMIKYPFTILKRAAEDLQESWSKNISTVNQTQGYTKDDLMALMSSLTSRLRDEGLSDVIAGTDIIEALSKVLSSGLSGPVAEEFAYQASKLGKAIPTQDFFDFAKSYSSVAANAIKDGASQSEAITKANEALYTFTNNLLYANRELTGGFTTGLKDATELYEKSIKIAQAARSDNVSQISGVLTAVAGVTGAIAPDLASSLTDTLYKLATGGNSEDIVALRSLAGINASNTDFLRAFAQNPQGIIAQMFNNLGNMFNESSDAYMEKAEGYASLFGLSSEAFQRIDFNYLAQQIANMNTGSSAINENLSLLASGQSTATKEQLKIAEINKMMIDEGLAYVIDNEFAQMIQEHMWEEQQTRELTEAMYAVDLQGGALEFIEGIKETVQNILDFLNPLSWLKKLFNLIATAAEGAAQKADIQAILEAGKVGHGNATELMQLTTTNRDLHLVPQLAEMMTGYSAYGTARAATKMMQKLTSPALTVMDGVENLVEDAQVYVRTAASMVAYQARNSSGLRSKYSWGGLTSKGDAATVSNLLALTVPAAIKASSSATEAASATEKSANVMSSRVEEMIQTIDQYVKDNKSYDDWKASAFMHGIADFDKAIEAAGYTNKQLQYYFQDKETAAGVEEKHNNEMLQWLFYRRAVEFLGGMGERKFWEDFNDPLAENLLVIQTKQDAILDAINEYSTLYAENNKSWENHWKEYANYYLYHQIYNGGTLSLVKLRQVQLAEKDEEGDLMTALSKFLSDNDWNLEDFRDPQVQANALLSKILIIVTAIMNQNNEKVGSISLADSLSALSMGMTGSTAI